MGDFLMPSLGADMVEGRLIQWRVAPGDVVAKGDIVAVVDTSKAEIEVEIFEAGVIEELVVDPGEKVAVGAVLAHVRSTVAATQPPVAPEPTAAEPVSTATGPAPAQDEWEPRPIAPEPTAAESAPPVPAAVVAAAAAAAAPTPPAEPPGAAGGSGRRRVSPLARRVAAHLGVDPASCEGTGPGGAVTRADVERAAAEPATRAPAPPAMPAPSAMPAPPAMPAPSAPAPQTIEPPAVAPAAAARDERSIAMRRTIARLMARSKREIPHYYLGHHIDLSRALDWLKERNAPRGPAERVLPAALLLKAVALACREHPGLNGFWVDDELRPGGGVHVGVAISLRGGGLLAPAIHDADTLGVEALMTALRDLTQRARRGQLRGSEMADPTITVTSLGERGVETVYGVIHPPQVALVGFGRVTERAWAVGGMVGARPVVHATLAVDHRAADGHTGGLFLGSIDSRLQEPEAL